VSEDRRLRVGRARLCVLCVVTHSPPVRCAACAAAAAPLPSCPPAPDSFLHRFFEATRDLSPAERGAFLESPPSDAPDIEEAHQVRRGGGGAQLRCSVFV
jgi:hypothetical protein